MTDPVRDSVATTLAQIMRERTGSRWHVAPLPKGSGGAVPGRSFGRPDNHRSAAGGTIESVKIKAGAL